MVADGRSSEFLLLKTKSDLIAQGRVSEFLLLMTRSDLIAQGRVSQVRGITVLHENHQR